MSGPIDIGWRPSWLSAERTAFMLSVACPYCDAPVGTACRNLAQPLATAQFPHSARFHAADNPGAQTPAYMLTRRGLRTKPIEPVLDFGEASA